MMAAKGCMVVFVALTMATTSSDAAIISKSNVVLVDGGYENVVVALDDSLDENQELIQAIQDMFQDASTYLYRATRNRVYFRNVKILLPPHWSSRPEYGSPGRLTFDTADVRVAPANPLWGADPYTQQVQGCGKPGSFIHFVQEIFTSENTKENYGNLGRVLVHEWGHYRWGLFNEYPDPVGDSEHVTYFYQSEDKSWKPVSCSEGYNIYPFVQTTLANGDPLFRPCSREADGGYEDGCLAIPLESGTATGSIMYGYSIFDQIVNFCDDEESDQGSLHNREAVNKHNRLCGTRSAWAVMREHEDFRDGNSSATDLGDDVILPTFSIVQARSLEDCRVVLVLDTSGSMSTKNRIQKVISASTAFTSSVRDGTWMGIVTFTGTGEIKHDLIQVTSQTERTSLHNRLALSANGGTCIGCGLDVGLQVLRQHPSGDLAGGMILLMSDGEDGAFINHPSRQTLQLNGVRVDTLAIGDDSTKQLNAVSEETGGSAFFYSDEGRTAEILGSLIQTVEQCSGLAESDKRIQVLSTGFSLGRDEAEVGSVFIDSSIGNGTEFIVTYTQGSGAASGVILTIVRPDGGTISVGSDLYDDQAARKIVLVTIAGEIMSGEWSYRVENTNSDTQSVTMSIYSRPNVEGGDTIKATSQLNNPSIDLSKHLQELVAYAQVQKGGSPIIDAAVTATVERPGGFEPRQLELLDNGVGADVTANDGVYSRSFVDYTTAGFYGVSITAENDGRAKVATTNTGSRTPVFLNISEDGELLNKGTIGNYRLRLPEDPVTADFVPAEPFTRSASAESTSVPAVPAGFVPGQDLFPPNRVQDLLVEQTFVENLTLVLVWTAPGDDLDSGSASLYDIRISHSSDRLLDDFSNAAQLNKSHILQGDVSNPKPFGSVERYVILVPDVPASMSFSYVLSLRAMDDEGLQSPMSNPARATFRRVIPTASAPEPDADQTTTVATTGATTADTYRNVLYADAATTVMSHAAPRLAAGAGLVGAFVFAASAVVTAMQLVGLAFDSQSR